MAVAVEGLIAAKLPLWQAVSASRSAAPPTFIWRFKLPQTFEFQGPNIGYDGCTQQINHRRALFIRSEKAKRDALESLRLTLARLPE